MTTLVYPTSAEFVRMGFYHRMKLERRLRLSHQIGVPTSGVHIVPDGLAWHVTNGSSSATTSSIGLALRLLEDSEKGTK
jgi:hypothetical protein